MKKAIKKILTTLMTMTMGMLCFSRTVLADAAMPDSYAGDNTGLVVVIVILAVLVCAGLIFFFMKMTKKKQSEKVAAEQKTEGGEQ